MGFSRKVAVARARELDIVVCRHSRLYTGVCVLRAVDDAGLCAGLGRVAGSVQAGSRRQGARSRRRADWRCGEGRSSAARGGLVLCGVLSVGAEQ